MLGAKQMTELLTRLQSADVASRDLVASEMTDLLEADQFRDREFRAAVRALMDAALTEKDAVVKESLFNALSSASTSPLAGRVRWDPIAASLDHLGTDCLEHALVILGFSRDPKYRAKVEQYLRSDDETVRQTAAEALALLDSEEKPNIRHG